MRSVIRFSLDNKFALLLMTLIVAAAGIYSGLNMKRESIPDISLPYLSVTTVYPGASPETVVERVTAPLEQRLKSVRSVENIMSTSMENASNLIIEFDYGTDMDRATNEVREAISDVRLPEEAEEPRIARFSFNSIPVISLSASADGMSMEELTRLVEEAIRPALEGIEGVASVQVSGQHVKEVRLRYDEAKMAELGLSRDTVEAFVQASTLKAPLGLFTIDGIEKAVVVDGGVTTLEELKNLEIPLVPGGGAAAGQAGAGAAFRGADAGPPGTDMPGMDASGAGAALEAGRMPDASAGFGLPAAGLPTVKLDDIASIETVGYVESISRTNGQESIGIHIVKDNDANTVQVVNAVKAEVERFVQELEGLELIVMQDQGELIDNSVRTMLDKAMYGAVFAALVILLFLRNIRSTLIAVVSIPLSLVVALLLLDRFDITLNIMTLGAMTVAIGRVVDDSIVVIENTYRRMTLKGEKLKGKELVLESTREMFKPILSSTIVTVAVFLPLGLVTGMVGELFMPFALTIVFALLASLLVAVTVVPALGHLLFRRGVKESRLHDASRPRGMAAVYRRVLDWSLRHKLVTFLMATALFLGSVALLAFRVVGVSFLPEEDQKYAIIAYTPEPGATVEIVAERALAAEKAILEARDPDLLDMQYSVGGENPLQPGPSRSGLFFLKYRNDTEDFEAKKEALLERLREAVPEGEWADVFVSAHGGFGSRTFSIGVYGDSLEEIRPVAERIAELMREDGNFERVETSITKTYEQYTIAADQAKLARYGLTPGQIAMALTPVRERPVLAKVSVDGDVYNVYVEVPQAEFRSADDIRNTTLESPLGVKVPIGEVAEVVQGTSPDTITRENGRTVVTVSGEITAKDVGGVSDAFLRKAERVEKPASVEIKAGGVSEQIDETFSQLRLAMAAAVAIVYLVLVLTFGGALAPFAIMFSLPFAVIGGVAALWIAGEPLNVSAMMGALMLIGIVVTNAIVLVDRVIRMEKEGLSTREALLEAAGTRLRPILMTALATVGALLPLVFGLEGAGIISFGLGITVIGGLISSTLLTLVIVPIVYETLMKLRRWALGSAE
ncbi:MAG TPA: efflux RND transporter permease subunit [Paenibacillaceae bacterium]